MKNPIDMKTVWRSTGFGLLLFVMALTNASAEEELVDFQLADMDGKIHRLSDYRGNWVLVNYWATWCPPCREELPDLELFHSKGKDAGKMVLGIDMEDIAIDELRAYVDEQFLSFPILLGPTDSSQLLGPVPGLPTSYLIAPSGKIVARQVGQVSLQGLEDFIANYDASAAEK